MLYVGQNTEPGLAVNYLVQLLDGASAHQDSLDALRRLRVDGLPYQKSPVHLGGYEPRTDIE